jgi:hypothetical protein
LELERLVELRLPVVEGSVYWTDVVAETVVGALMMELISSAPTSACAWLGLQKEPHPEDESSTHSSCSLQHF